MALAARHAAALISIITLISSTLVPGVNAQRVEPPRLSEDQRILHVLNRLGFGARPNDVERVKAMGLDRYIEQQLHPERIRDDVAEAKVRELPSLSMSTPELYAKYPQPGALIRQLQRRGDLPADLSALRQNKGAGATPNAAGATNNTAEASAKAEGAAAQGSDKKDYRQAVRDYYIQNNLLPPQRITAELQASRILRAVYSERQLQEAMVDFWENHFNIFANKGADRWLLVSYDRDTIRPNAMGKFQDLLLATAESPAMLFYLDNFQSVSPNAQVGNRMGQLPQRQRNPLLNQIMRGRIGGRGMILNPNAGLPPQGSGGNNRPNPPAQAQKAPKRGINENYARELMELHTLGVDGGYTQKDVQEVARCLTGWTIMYPRANGTMNEDAGKFVFNPRLHDNGEKVVLCHKIPAGGGVNDGLMVIDILAHHPSTARFIATKLCRHFVTDNPSPELVARVAAAFTKSDGDIRETMRAVITSPEFNSPAAYRAKIKTPFELVTSAIRALGGETNGAQPIHQWMAKMGQPLYGYQAPTGYPDTAEYWVNTGSLLERLNFGLALASNRIPGTHVDLARFVGSEAANGPAADKTRVLDRFLNVILQGDVSPNTKQTLLKQVSEQAAAPTAKTEMDRLADTEVNVRAARREIARTDATVGNPEVTKIVGLILGSPEFQRQ